MNFDDLNLGEKRAVHVNLYERELEMLDAFCEMHRCSRSVALGAILRRYAEEDFTGKVPEPEHGERSHRWPRKGTDQ